MAVTLNETPSANRLHIGIFGKTNSGKSSFINAFSGQKVSIVADIAGTTTDPVYKPMEIYPLGPCVLIDTAGFADEGELGALRMEKTRLAAQKTDAGIILFSGRDMKEELDWFRYFKEKNQALYVIFHLALETAMRQGEILSLRWEHVDLQHGVAHLPTTKNGAPRDVPLSRKARNYLQMLPTQLNGNIFSYTSSGFKSAWRTALQELKIENLHFHDLRHEAISRFFELGTLNVIEVAAISGHRSLNMLKRYTHLRAYQLVSKLDARRKQTSKIAPYFVPYPATVENRNGQVVVTLSDFDLETSAATKEQAIFHASVLLLRTLAQAAQRGERVPTPGELPTNIDERVMICPLTN